ncbi:MAG: tRNA (adenosine(37)-N6)-dimethylallyltransferase MiaA [Desulfovibrionaceae bacterium]|nr:tRNA (adenosine(37)-N6)-dimethylallyltransferase MiaA [Desulfovibrionaceae bacterium]
MNKIHCIAIVGATGTGKTALSLLFAEYLCMMGYTSAIINMDSRQVYRELPIISAQPTQEQKERVPHYYYGYLEITDILHVEYYVESIYTLCKTLWEQGTIPIIVGGTGMYFYILFNGIAPIPPIDEKIRKEQREYVLHNIKDAYSQLSQYDPLFASSITPYDTQRIARGLEVLHSTGIPLSQWHQHKKTFIDKHTSIALQKPTPLLQQHLYLRISEMISSGAIEEVEIILRNHSGEYGQASSCIGFQEIKDYLEGKNSYEECIENWFIHTRQYAKRQRTWFAHKHHVHHWLQHIEYEKEVLRITQEYISSIKS